MLKTGAEHLESLRDGRVTLAQSYADALTLLAADPSLAPGGAAEHVADTAWLRERL